METKVTKINAHQLCIVSHISTPNDLEPHSMRSKLSSIDNWSSNSAHKLNPIPPTDEYN